MRDFLKTSGFRIDFFYLVNANIILFLFLGLILLHLKLQHILRWRKLFIFINVVCATLLSPPDVYSQILILFILSLIIESIIFFSFYSLNLQIKKLKG
jgi:Sec-independent protein secretion pathway component TatC